MLKDVKLPSYQEKRDGLSNTARELTVSKVCSCIPWRRKKAQRNKSVFYGTVNGHMKHLHWLLSISQGPWTGIISQQAPVTADCCGFWRACGVWQYSFPALTGGCHFVLCRKSARHVLLCHFSGPFLCCPKNSVHSFWKVLGSIKEKKSSRLSLYILQILKVENSKIK